MPVSVVDCYLIPPSWFGSRKPLSTMWNWSRLLVTFSMSLPAVLSKTMGQKDLGMLYDSLFGLGMITVLAALKWNSQYSMLIQASVMFTIFSKHRSLENRVLRCFQEMWSGPGANDNEHLAIVSLNSCLEKAGQSMRPAWGISLRKQMSTGLFSAELYELWRACHRSGRVLQGQFSYEMDSIAGINFFPTQFIKSQGLLFEDAISYILSLKNFFLVDYITALNSFQCWRSPDAWYLLRPMIQSWFHHFFECFVMFQLYMVVSRAFECIGHLLDYAF